MELPDGQLALLYSNEAFRKMAANRPISIFEFNTITNLLIVVGVPYDVSFVAGTRKQAGALQLTIHINPTRNEVFVVALSPGSTAFTFSP